MAIGSFFISHKPVVGYVIYPQAPTWLTPMDYKAFHARRIFDMVVRRLRFITVDF